MVGKWEDNNLNIVSRKNALLLKKQGVFRMYYYCNICICIVVDEKIRKIEKTLNKLGKFSNLICTINNSFIAIFK